MRAKLHIFLQFKPQESIIFAFSSIRLFGLPGEDGLCELSYGIEKQVGGVDGAGAAVVPSQSAGERDGREEGGAGGWMHTSSNHSLQRQQHSP